MKGRLSYLDSLNSFTHAYRALAAGLKNTPIEPPQKSRRQARERGGHAICHCPTGTVAFAASLAAISRAARLAASSISGPSSVFSTTIDSTSDPVGCRLAGAARCRIHDVRRGGGFGGRRRRTAQRDCAGIRSQGMTRRGQPDFSWRRGRGTTPAKLPRDRCGARCRHRCNRTTRRPREPRARSGGTLNRRRGHRCRSPCLPAPVPLSRR